MPAPDVSKVLGLVFTHPDTGEAYGVIRKLSGKPQSHPSASQGLAFAEDECGNAFVQTGEKQIEFWDHETEELTPLATTWKKFVAGCDEPKEVDFDEAEVDSAWVDPEFAKELGIDVPPDGYIKKKGS